MFIFGYTQKNKNGKQEKHATGFTEIELLIIIAIVTIIPTIIVSNFPKITLQFALSRIAYKCAQDIRRSQDLALSSVQYKDSGGAVKPVNGYGVYMDINGLGSKKYLIYADNKVAGVPQRYDSGVDYIVETIDFSSSEKNIVIKEINNVVGNTVSVNFNPPNPDTTIYQLSGGQTKVDIVFALESDVTTTRTISVNTSGLIEVR